ncbi:MAG: hypothetical protein INF98_16740 [Roseomonas sp.]|jgi:hypothetical protein|nr:hypothetical protein [Roseomonas sp.]
MSSVFQENVSGAGWWDQTIASIASKFTFGGSGFAIGSWVLSSEAGVFFGLLLGVAGLVVNWFYKHRADKRQQAEHQRRMEALGAQPLSPHLVPVHALPPHAPARPAESD